jgi:hypothetical protein
MLLSRRQQRLQILYHPKLTAPSKEKCSEDCIGLEMVNILKSSLQSGEDSECYDSDKLFLLSLVDDFKNMSDYSKSRVKIEMVKFIQSYQPQPVFSAYHSQHEIYPNSWTAFNNAAAPSPSRHEQRLLLCLVSG